MTEQQAAQEQWRLEYFAGQPNDAMPQMYKVWDSEAPGRFFIVVGHGASQRLQSLLNQQSAALAIAEEALGQLQANFDSSVSSFKSLLDNTSLALEVAEEKAALAAEYRERFRHASGMDGLADEALAFESAWDALDALKAGR